MTHPGTPQPQEYPSNHFDFTTGSYVDLSQLPPPPTNYDHATQSYIELPPPPTNYDPVTQSYIDKPEYSANLYATGSQEAIRERRSDATWGLDFQAGFAGYGDIRKKGYEAWLAGHPDNQDAFAVSTDGKRFAVADGMGSSVNKEGTALLAKYLASAVVKGGVDFVFDKPSMDDFYEDFAMYENGPNPDEAMGAMAGIMARWVGTTLSVCEIGKTTTYPGGVDVRIVTIGDSPVYIADEEGNVVQEFGEDAGETSQRGGPIRHTIGITRPRPGEVVRSYPEKDVIKRNKAITDITVNVPIGHAIIMGSDALSDGFEAVGGLKGLVKSRLDFETGEIRRKTGDDTTMIMIDPNAIVDIEEFGKKQKSGESRVAQSALRAIKDDSLRELAEALLHEDTHEISDEEKDDIEFALLTMNEEHLRSFLGSILGSILDKVTLKD